VTLDPKIIVAKGYDEIADEYLRQYSSSAVRESWLDTLVEALPNEKSVVLDLGCGAGVPVPKRLVELGHRVVGIDGSARQLALARANVEAAEFIHADMTAVELPEASFDGVAAFYSITHLPAGEHGRLLQRIAAWLRPSGVFVGSFGIGPAGDWRGQWLGTEMYFSHHDEATSRSLIVQAGLEVIRAEVIEQDDEDARFLWIVALKP
jgi:SAM-dependent methyltransferase